MMNFWYRIKNQKATGAVALAVTLAPGKMFRLMEIRVHLSAAVVAVEDLTIKLNSGAGAAYDVVLLTQAMNGLADLIYRPTDPMIFQKADELDVAFANTNTNTYGIELVYQEI